MANVTKGKVTPVVSTALLDAYQAVLDEAKKDLEAQLLERTAEYEKELTRKKEEDEYKFNIAKRDREDKLNQELASRTAAVAEREAVVKTREVAIGDAEKVIAGLQKQVDGIPQAVAAAEAAGVKKGFAEAEKHFQAEFRIKDAEHKSAHDVKDHKIEVLSGRIAELEGTLEHIRNDLKAANLRVETIANNAVTAASKQQVVVQNTPAPSGR